MSNKIEISDTLRTRMEELGIDVGLTLQILTNYNNGKYDHMEPVKVTSIPEVDNDRIIDISDMHAITLKTISVQENLKKLGIDLDPADYGTTAGDSITFQNDRLRELGIRLYPLLSYGVLNGGSASSYVDIKKNKQFNEKLFSICEKEFHSLEKVSKGKAKGLTPAFINKDGTHGPSFLELKMRSLLINILHYQIKTGKKDAVLFPAFQMTSVYNNGEIETAYDQYEKSPLLADLVEATGVNITRFFTGIQPMLAAMTHKDEGKQKDIFRKAYGKEDSPLPMPGGHGQSFTILKNIYLDLFREGKRFIYIGNVDNLGFTVNPVCLAILALKGSQAGFDFSFRTPVDVKGGVLVNDQDKRLNCADIGAAISKEDVLAQEKSGKKILFNCATGLFNLGYLVDHIDRIIEHLPMRISDQDKDAGRYSQAEQITWEVISLLDNPIIFGVDKYSRFLAAKMLLEGLMTSGIGLDNPDYPVDERPENNLKELALKLHNGLTYQLENAYGMKNDGKRWKCKSVDELRKELSK